MRLVLNWDNIMDNEIILEITEDIVKEYEEDVYFQKYPKRKKKPIEKPFPPSLNKFIIWKRPQQNAIKQVWKEFMQYIAFDYTNLEIDSCEIHFHFIFHDKRRRDLDNYLSTSAKLIIDGLTKEDGNNMIVDDSYNIIKKISASAEYQKGINKTIITIKY